ncbi:KRAB-A domain-containing protein 2-like protein [Plakobranchus ocellatus]|uniref:KRAB-A domain-containing protein 2-like protein n=1 Tax=Plakobranchus ocellatus TaxID=259542 RepID=A0AAV4BKX2_9GAST|nr:KRAB-A domain-containing protein 2-like protein [Plakobranchus ocellatus]
MQISALNPLNCLNLCALRAGKRKRGPKQRKELQTTGVVVRPIPSKDFSYRGQVDLVDMQLLSFNGFMDHGIPRSSVKANALWNGKPPSGHFSLVGCSSNIAKCQRHRIYRACHLKTGRLLALLKMVHGKPRHPQSQESVKLANRGNKNMLVPWLGDNDTQDWMAGIKLVQFK